MESLLPKKKTQQDVIAGIKHIVLYGLPKSGKTTAAALIDRNVILKFEPNSNIYVESYNVDFSYDANSPDSIKQTLEKIKKIVEELKQDTTFKFVTIDSLSSILPLAEYVGEILYSQTSFGKNWFTELKKDYHSILNLPRGAGYDFYKKGLNKIYDALFSSGKIIITLAHVKDKVNADGNVSMLEIDAPGNISRSIAKDAQMIGYVYRATPEEVYVSFNNAGNVLTGSTVPKLHGKSFLISKKIDDNTIVGLWKEMLPELF